MDNYHLTTVASFQEVSTASLAQNILREAGIPCFLGDAETITTDWLLSNAMGGIKLKVPVSEVERAKELLSFQLDDDDKMVLADEAIAAGDETTEAGGADEEQPEPVLSPREELAQRAWRGSLLSLAFPPFYFMIAWMLWKVLFSEERLEQPYRGRALMAALLTVPLVTVMASGLLLLMQSILRGV